MTRQTSEALRAAVHAQQTDVAFIMLLTISSANLSDDIRVCNDAFELLPEAGVRGVVSREQEYIFLPFECLLPAEDDTGIAKAQLSIDNVSREIITSARSAGSAAKVTIEVVLSSDVDTPEVTIPNLRLDDIAYTVHAITANISVEYRDKEPFPYGRMDPSRYPGLH